MKIMKTKLQIVTSLLLLLSSYINAQKLEIQYMANEGVLIKSSKVQLLIDATFNKEFDYLDVLPDTELDKIKNAEDPYNSINILLATHLHGDHFNAEITGNHLLHNPNALFVGPKETVANFKENFTAFNDISGRVVSIMPGFLQSETHNLKDIEIEALRFEHLGGSPWNEAENVAYLITVEGKKILHLGDSKIDLDRLKEYNIPDKNIDVLIVHFTLLGEKEIIERISPKIILAGHIPLNSQSKIKEYKESLGYGNVTLLTKQLWKLEIK